MKRLEKSRVDNFIEAMENVPQKDTVWVDLSLNTEVLDLAGRQTEFVTALERLDYSFISADDGKWDPDWDFMFEGNGIRMKKTMASDPRVRSLISEALI